MRMPYFVMLSTVALLPPACSLPESESFGENDPAAGRVGAAAGTTSASGAEPGAAAGTELDRANGGSTSVASTSTGGSDHEAPGGGASAAGAAGRTDAGRSGGTGGSAAGSGGAADGTGAGGTTDGTNRASGGTGAGGASDGTGAGGASDGAAGVQVGIAGENDAGAAGAAGAAGEVCEYAYCLTLEEGLDLSDACPLTERDYLMPFCGYVATGDCSGRETIRTYVADGEYMDCYFSGGSLVGMANVTDHGTWVAGELAAPPSTCDALLSEDLPLCPRVIETLAGLACPAVFPEIGAACEENNRCRYTYDYHCTEGCTTEVQSVARCLGGAWEPPTPEAPDCAACGSDTSALCPEDVPMAGAPCTELGAVCNYSWALDCPEGCSGGDMQQRSCIERTWYDTMHTSGAPMCYCPVNVSISSTVEYQTSSISPRLKLCNTADSTMALAGVAMKYWFDQDEASGDVVADLIDAPDEPSVGTEAVNLAAGADQVVVLTFGEGHVLEANACTEVTLMLHTADDAAGFDATDDWSYLEGEEVTNTHVAVYDSQGTLVWGEEPS